MKFFDFLHVLDPNIDPANCKLHLAKSDGENGALDVFRRGEFEAWQASQSRRNFEREHIIALISYAGADTWLFAGCYDAGDCVQEAGDEFGNEGKRYIYSTQERAFTKDFSGRVVVNFQRSGRQSYLNAENNVDDLTIHEVLAERETFSPFPGFYNIRLNYTDLQHMVRTEQPSWKGALSGMGGIYVILDTKTGKLYVGKADGQENLWARWSTYANTGHGGNEGLKKLLEDDPSYAENFQYSVLETHDLKTNASTIEERESFWKNVLGSRHHGYNEN